MILKFIYITIMITKLMYNIVLKIFVIKLEKYLQNISHLMGKPTICIGENKCADQLRSNCEADRCLCFRYTDSTIPLLSKSKIPASSSLLCLYRSVCVGTVRKPHCWFFHEATHMAIRLSHLRGHTIIIFCFPLFRKFVDPTITCFEPEAMGNLIVGMDFHKFYFDHGA